MTQYSSMDIKEKWAIVKDGEDSASKLKVKGFPFQKSYTIYRGNDIVAQLSYITLAGELIICIAYAKRNKFRLTIFPRSDDHALVVALVVIFLD
ncbi:protein LURP-one-related 7-like [Quercus robur]|uniref:protein LURP-one-related 7-like n=1 Tax=Quercus robur TaxID=38942 RepID=UPI0021618D64|nr:protein LURP-one-related 7-like [Quercus robur]